MMSTFTPVANDKQQRKPKESAILLVETSTWNVFYRGFKLEFPDRSNRNACKSFLLIQGLANAALEGKPFLGREEIFDIVWPVKKPQEPDKRLGAYIKQVINMFGKLTPYSWREDQLNVPENLEKTILRKDGGSLAIGLNPEEIDIAWSFKIPKKWRYDWL